MSWFRGPLRLADRWVDNAGMNDAATYADAALATALRDWGAQAGDARAIARLEQQLAAALGQPRSTAQVRSVGAAAIVMAEPLASPAPSAPPAPAWLLGLWALNAAIAIVLSSPVSPAQLADTQTGAARTPAPGLFAVEVASRLGVGPRELAAYDALDPWHAAR